jgi:hypothetical protein
VKDALIEVELIFLMGNVQVIVIKHMKDKTVSGFCLLAMNPKGQMPQERGGFDGSYKLTEMGKSLEMGKALSFHCCARG